MFGELEKGKYGAILADPPWDFKLWSKKGAGRSAEHHYQTMTNQQLKDMPVMDLAAENCVLFLWTCWPKLIESLDVVNHWGFEYKTCAFAWLKADNRQADMFKSEIDAQVGMGYWTRANSEPCLLFVRGKPKRLNADVRQGIIAPRREHSRKPDGVHEKIERLVAGPYCELFGRQKRKGWDVWGNQTDKFQEVI